jgi:16S rRNA (guanine527-N7)-methyltransferase
MTDSELLREGLRQLGFTDSNTQEQTAQSLEIYLNELKLFNKTHSLVSEHDTRDIIIKHVFDSLAALSHIQSLAANKTQSVIADIGSGGGFPGIPLAVCMSDARFTLIERMKTRCAFLQNCVSLMNLTNVSIENMEMEKITPHSFDVCVFRSFHPLTPKLAQTLLSLTVPGGHLAAYKAKLSAIKEEMKEIESLEWKAEKLSVPFLSDHERHLVIIQTKN